MRCSFGQSVWHKGDRWWRFVRGVLWGMLFVGDFYQAASFLDGVAWMCASSVRFWGCNLFTSLGDSSCDLRNLLNKLFQSL